MKRYYYLYKITNLINEKIYIGVHSTDNLDDGYFGSGSGITRAIKKYGKEWFSKEILEYFHNESEMYSKESNVVNEEFVKQNNNYNNIIGGHKPPTNSFKGKRHTELSKEKIRTARKLQICSEDTKKKMSESRRGNKHWQFGKSVKEETKDKIRQANLGKMYSVETNSKKGSKEKKNIIACPYCKKVGGAPQMKQWHFDNCKIRHKMNKKIGFIGVGKLGMECAEAMAYKGHSVEAYDVSPRTTRKVIMCQTIKEVLKNKNIIFIAVPTPHNAEYGGELPTSYMEPKDFNYDIVKQVLDEVNKHATKNQLIVLISTVLPGTTRRELAHRITNARFIYNPYLIAMGSVAWDMLNPEMVIIGTEDGSLTGDAKELVDFYKTIMENDPRYEIGTWDEAESIKIFYNTFISAKIGLVNMIQDVAEKQGNINVDVVTGALARSTQRIMGPKYMIAGGPDGGACHPRDNIALRWMADNLDLGYDLFGSIMYAREEQTRLLAKKVIREAGNMPIVIVGKAYKPGVDYLEGSGSLLVEHYIKEHGKSCYFLDKYTGDLLPDSISSVPCAYLLMHDAEVTYCDSPMKETVTKQEIRPVSGSVIIDIWRKQKSIDGCKVVHYGNTRQQTS